MSDEDSREVSREDMQELQRRIEEGEAIDDKELCDYMVRLQNMIFENTKRTGPITYQGCPDCLMPISLCECEKFLDIDWRGDVHEEDGDEFEAGGLA